MDYQWPLPPQKEITKCYVLPNGNSLVKQTYNLKNDKTKPECDQTSRSNYQLIRS